MKILGASTLKRRTISVTVGTDEDGNELKLVMRPIKFGKLMEIEREIPEPIAPSTGTKAVDPVTRQPIRRNGAFVMVRDTGDKDHLLKMEFREMAVNVATVVHSLGDQVAEVRARSSDQTAMDYWLSVLDDLTDAGIDQGIFHMLVAAAVRLSKPLTNLDLILMRKELGTDLETDATTEEQEKETAATVEKAKAAGKA